MDPTYPYVTKRSTVRLLLRASFAPDSVASAYALLPRGDDEVPLYERGVVHNVGGIVLRSEAVWAGSDLSRIRALVHAM